jgi:hypothetical protein
MTATLALFCGVKSELIERLLKNVHHDGHVACRAAKLNWPTVPWDSEARFLIIRSRLRSWKTPRTLSELSEAAAQRSIRSASVQTQAKKAG